MLHWARFFIKSCCYQAEFSSSCWKPHMGHPVVLNNNVLLENSHFTLIIVIRRNVSTKCPSKIKPGTYIHTCYFFHFLPICVFSKIRPLYFSPSRMSKPFIFPLKKFFIQILGKLMSHTNFFLEKLTFPQNRNIIL